MEHYHYDNVHRLIGQHVQLLNDAGDSLDLTLSEVIKGPMHGNNDAQSFSLLFQAPQDQTIEQGCYTFVHEKLGEQSLLISPCPGAEYEVVINFYPHEHETTTN